MVFLRTGVSPDRRATETQIDDEMIALGTQVINEINWSMRESGVNRTELAERMGVSPGRISQILGGGENLTLRTLAALSTALDARFNVELAAVKGANSYPRRDPARVQADPAGNHRITARARRREARLGRR